MQDTIVAYCLGENAVQMQNAYRFTAIMGTAKVEGRVRLALLLMIAIQVIIARLTVRRRSARLLNLEMNHAPQESSAQGSSIALVGNANLRML